MTKKEQNMPTTTEGHLVESLQVILDHVSSEALHAKEREFVRRVVDDRFSRLCFRTTHALFVFPRN